MYDAKEVARYIIHYGNQKGYWISNLKLQKILYFVQAYFLLDTGQPCFKNRMEAWDFGPVVPEVYFQYRYYGANPILDVPDTNQKVSISMADQIRINGLVDTLDKYSASKLVTATHQQTPWKNAYEQGNGNGLITPQAIKEYFDERRNRSTETATKQSSE